MSAVDDWKARIRELRDDITDHEIHGSHHDDEKLQDLRSQLSGAEEALERVRADEDQQMQAQCWEDA